MLSRSNPIGLRSLALRLTLMYALVCTVSLLAILAVSYLALDIVLKRELDEALAGEIGEYAALLKSQEISVLQDVLTREAVSEGTDQVFFRVLSAEGKEVLSTDMGPWAGVDVSRSHLDAAARGRTVFGTDAHPSRPYPARIVYGRIGPGLVLQLGESTASNAQVLRSLRHVYAAGTVGFVLCSVLVGVFMARRALSGVRRVTEGVEAISRGGWDHRVSVSPWDDEVDELAAAFNDMVDRIQALIRELKEVTDDIAHDLRTPVTRMRMAAEAALLAGDASGDDEILAGSIIEECDQLLDLINTMLEISQTESGVRPVTPEPLDLSRIVENVCELFGPAAEDKGIALHVTPGDALPIHGEPGKLRRAIAHIVDNAMKYTNEGGSIAVTCAPAGGMARVSIRDSGVGIPREDLDKVFARFYRVDRSRPEGGNGLGLSLSRAILRAHGGDVTIESAAGQGTTVTLTVPLPKRSPVTSRPAEPANTPRVH